MKVSQSASYLTSGPPQKTVPFLAECVDRDARKVTKSLSTTFAILSTTGLSYPILHRQGLSNLSKPLHEPLGRYSAHAGFTGVLRRRRPRRFDDWIATEIRSNLGFWCFLRCFCAEGRLKHRITDRIAAQLSKSEFDSCREDTQSRLLKFQFLVGHQFGPSKRQQINAENRKVSFVTRQWPHQFDASRKCENSHALFEI